MIGRTSKDRLVGPAQLEHASLPATKVRDALDTYLVANNFTLAAYDAPRFELPFLGRTLSFPNTPQRKWAIPLHDLHHVATGYGTDIVGEAEIGAWELGAGCRTSVVYALNIAVVTFGLVLAPIRVLRAFRRGLRGRTLYRLGLKQEACLTLDVSALRARLGIPAEGWVDRRRRVS